MQFSHQNTDQQTMGYSQYYTEQQLKKKQKQLEQSSKANNERFLVAVMVFGATIILGFVYFTFQFKYWNADIKIQGQQISEAFKDYTEESNKLIKDQIALLQQKIQQFKSSNGNNERQIIVQILKINNQFQNLKSKTMKINELIKNGKVKQKYSIQSKILNNFQDVKTIVTFFPKPIKNFKLLYRASENNFQVSKFHQKCDNIPNTLIVIKTQEGKIIGGFTQLIWDKNLNEKWSIDDKNQTFIYSIPLREKMHLKKANSEAIKNYEKIGPVFAGPVGPADLIVFDNANNNTASFAGFPTSFNNEKNYSSKPETRQKFLGTNQLKSNFKIAEWQVFEVVFK